MQKKYVSYAVILTLIATLNLTTGCKWWRAHFGPKDAKGSTTPPPVNVDGSGKEIAVGERGPITQAEIDKARGQFAPVMFEYDSARIKPSEMSKIEAVAAAMKGNSKKLIIEGNTDERGTAEYNRALGERRAGAAREALVRQGIEASRISTISYGKDKPADTGQDDAAHARNRRDEFLLVNQ